MIIADARVPEDDSAYNTFSMTGDSSDSSEPYSEISNIAESGNDIIAYQNYYALVILMIFFI